MGGKGVWTGISRACSGGLVEHRVREGRDEEDRRPWGVFLEELARDLEELARPLEVEEDRRRLARVPQREAEGLPLAVHRGEEVLPSGEGVLLPLVAVLVPPCPAVLASVRPHEEEGRRPSSWGHLHHRRRSLASRGWGSCDRWSLPF